METTRLYLYLGKRDKTGIKMVSLVQGPKITARISDVKQLNLDTKWEQRLSRIMYDNRMDYELFVEHADDYQELREKLKAKGYGNIPSSCNFSFPEMVSYRNPESADIKTMSKVFTMTRRANQPPQFIRVRY